MTSSLTKSFELPANTFPPFAVTLRRGEFRSQASISDDGPQGKFDSAIIVFPDRTTVRGGRLTELWLSLSSQHCHATLNAAVVEKGEEGEEEEEEEARGFSR